MLQEKDKVKEKDLDQLINDICQDSCVHLDLNLTSAFIGVDYHGGYIVLNKDSPRGQSKPVR